MLPQNFEARLRTASLICLSLLFLRITGLSLIDGGQEWARDPMHYLTFCFLPWNLFLAWTPWWLAHQTRRIAGLGSGWLLPYLLLWLLFFPNAPYVFTDFVHWRPRPPVPYWYDFLLVGCFAITAWMWGMGAWVRTRRWIFLKWGHSVLKGSDLLIWPLTALGLFLGRELRWNSWDALWAPLPLARDVWDALEDPSTWRYVLVTWLFLWMGKYVFSFFLTFSQSSDPV